ncbi:MAG TPA: tetratricopeptide repeat protein [Usitatibacter sp.]|nr:tetratricopeptide repeat protein [Usitatibacter sp.]
MQDSPASRALQQALEACRRSDWSEAERLCNDVLGQQPDHPDALNLLFSIASTRGAESLELKRHDEAIAFFDRALELRPRSGETHYNRGLALHALGRHEDAIESFGRAIAARPDLADAYNNRGVAQRDLGNRDEALQDYDRAISLNPSLAEAHNNRGVVLRELKRNAEALQAYDRAIAVRPGFWQAHSNRGALLGDMGRHAEALESQERAIALRPGFTEAWIRRGITQRDLGRHAESLGSLTRAMQIDPAFDWLEGQWLHAKMRLYDWKDFSANAGRLARRIEAGERATLPFPLIALPGSPALQRTCAETWVRARLRPKHPVSEMPMRAKGGRLRIGYFSANYSEHAVAYLIADLLEQHDRSSFEVTAFSFGPDTGDAMRKRVESAAERFVDIRDRTDEAVARLARELEIDVAVDLMGFTEDSRSGIFALRAAPVQVSYLGYPGTMGAEFIDYLIADATVVPEAEEAFYAERIIRMPGSYQVNGHRPISDRVFTREGQGLPQSGFVFCCFNNNYKITPSTFDSWMRILGRVEGSVLWVLGDNETAMRNLRGEAERRGIAASRLVFANRLPLAEYIARYRLADLFLDTLPYNAHSTASDALWSGLPVITRAGDTFAGRVGASLLHAVGLPELITETVAQYEDLAAHLATQPDAMRDVRRRLEENRLSMPLFDAPRFARDLEAAYREMLKP